MQSVQRSLAESETPQLPTTEVTRSAVHVADKQTSSEKKQSDQQLTAEALYAAFTWLFGSGCY